MKRGTAAVGLMLAILTGLQQPIVRAEALGQRQILGQARGTQPDVGTIGLYVNASRGSDTAGDGSSRLPLKTITKALELAQPGMVILLAPGTYSSRTGEIFPLRLKSDVTLQGDRGTKGRGIVISGGDAFLSPTFASQNIAILGADRSGLMGVTVSNSNPRGYGLWVESSSPIVADNTFTGSTHDGISVTGKGAPLIQGNYFYRNGANGITIYGTSRPEVRENVFEDTGFGVNIAQRAVPLVIGNRITRNKDGIVCQANAQPVLRDNLIEGNTRDGVVAIGASRPDLGSATAPGSNIFRRNGRFDINSNSSQIVPAFGNQLTASRTSGRVDMAGILSQSASTFRTIPPSTNLGSRLPNPTPQISMPIPVPPPAIIISQSISQPAPTLSADSFPIPSVLQRSATPQIPRSPTPPAPLNIPSRTTPSGPAAALLTVPVRVLPALPVRTPLPAPARPAPRPALRPAVKPIEEAPIPIFVSPPPGYRRRSTPVSRQSIPVPIVSPPSSYRPSATSAARPNAASGVLPVPTPNIPLGNTGKRSPVVMTPDGTFSNTPPPPANLASLRYRVVVDAIDDTQQTQVRSLIPGAFRTFSRGRMVMQAGAFGDRGKADELLQTLASQGLKATIESLE